MFKYRVEQGKNGISRVEGQSVVGLNEIKRPERRFERRMSCAGPMDGMTRYKPETGDKRHSMPSSPRSTRPITLPNQ